MDALAVEQRGDLAGREETIALRCDERAMPAAELIQLDWTWERDGLRDDDHARSHAVLQVGVVLATLQAHAWAPAPPERVRQVGVGSRHGYGSDESPHRRTGVEQADRTVSDVGLATADLHRLRSVQQSQTAGGGSTLVGRVFLQGTGVSVLQMLLATQPQEVIYVAMRIRGGCVEIFAGLPVE